MECSSHSTPKVESILGETTNYSKQELLLLGILSELQQHTQLLEQLLEQAEDTSFAEQADTSDSQSRESDQDDDDDYAELYRDARVKRYKWRGLTDDEALARGSVGHSSASAA